MAKILVVDNSKFSIEVLKPILIGAGHEVVGEAYNAKEGLSVCEKLRPELVTVDLVMPKVGEMDGIDLVKEIYNRFPDIKVVVISAHGQKAVQEDVAQAGASAFVQKPLNAGRITEKINEALGQVGKGSRAAS